MDERTASQKLLCVTRDTIPLYLYINDYDRYYLKRQVEALSESLIPDSIWYAVLNMINDADAATLNQYESDE